MASWKGNLILDNGKKINREYSAVYSPRKKTKLLRELQLSSQHEDAAFPQLPEAPLEMVAFVQTAQIPLHLAAGPSLLVETTSTTARDWFSETLIYGNIEEDETLGQEDAERWSWIDSHSLQSPLGVLAKTSSLPVIEESESPRVTELLFYAAKVSVKGGALPTPPTSSLPSSQNDGNDSENQEHQTTQRSNICIYALPLSSDLLYAPTTSTTTELEEEPTENEGRLLKSAFETKRQAQISKKRERLDDIFDTAPDRKKRARQQQVETFSQALATSVAFDGRSIKSEDAMRSPTLTEFPARPRPNTHARKLSRSMGVVDGRPPSSRGPPELRRSNLSNVTTDSFEDDTTETKNKQLISRVVLAGMRIYGLQQRKTQSRPNGTEDVGVERSDEEFKGVYHQAYKGVLFAFRHKMGDTILESESVRDVADKLLHVFCNDPQ